MTFYEIASYATTLPSGPFSVDPNNNCGEQSYISTRATRVTDKIAAYAYRCVSHNRDAPPQNNSTIPPTSSATVFSVTSKHLFYPRPIYLTTVSICARLIKLWPHGQVVKTSPFHGEIMGSNPVGVTKSNPVELRVRLGFCLSQFHFGNKIVHRNGHGILFLQNKIPTCFVGIVGICAIGVVKPYHYFVVI